MKTTNIFTCVSLLAIIVISCKKDDDTPKSTNSIVNNTTGSLTIDSLDRFTGYINGSYICYIANQNASASNGSAASLVTYPDTSHFRYTSGFQEIIDMTDIWNIIYGTEIGIEIGTLDVPGGGYPTNDLFATLFYPRLLQYSPDAENGVSIWLLDTNDVYWSTSLGSGIQNGSNFTIDTLKPGPSSSITTGYVKIMASFNCILYDSVGNSMSIDSALFIGFYYNY